MKVKFHNPIVELSGDEMAQVMWAWIKDILIRSYFEGPIITFDLSIDNRDRTEDGVTIEAAEAIKNHRVGVKCATITPDEQRVREFNLKKMWPSPNGTIRNYLNGTVFREPIIINSIPRLIPTWKKPIVIARHAYGDQYKPFEIKVSRGTSIKVLAGSEEKPAFHFDSDGVFLAMHNKLDSVEGFARSVFNYALMRGYDCYLSTKNTILKIYDGLFKETFENLFETEFKAKFDELNLKYEHKLIDDMVARVLKSEGGFVWALKNYDGDVQSDMVAQGFGSLGLMTSVLLSPDGQIVETEAAHGTVTRHFRLWQKGV
ncbi:MAG: NADP-dependent isocitrate dehydrogenase, partial [Deltaproteobacteria bacterium]|nr:NADP-dependent isocitrate dehydrogenase [Deltaproteobacteria bacterium]